MLTHCSSQQGGTQYLWPRSWLSTQCLLWHGPACGGANKRVLAGGAWGLLARAYGLGCDRIRAVTMVDAQGKVVQANSTHNSDLLWASCGGGGGNFGIVTSMRVQVRPHKAPLCCLNVRTLPVQQDVRH